MTDRIRSGVAEASSSSGKRQWIAPAIEIAPARNASAFAGPPGSVDYSFYS